MEQEQKNPNPPVGDKLKCENDTQTNDSALAEPSTSSSTRPASPDVHQVNSFAKPSDSDAEDENDDEDGEEIVTLEDYFKDEDEMESQVMAVIGDTDRNNCSYSKGYLPRQALYACKTCPLKEDSETGEKYLAGFCIGCSDHCHEGHEMVELFTKRNFRCDCGNEKFSNTICKLTDKMGFNEKNQYNHNFSGVYCTCNRPYPDPEDPIEDVMIQCGLCEDWFHSRHVFDKIDLEPNLTEMVCFLCVKKYEFLVYYYEDGLFETDELSDDSAISSTLSGENEGESSNTDYTSPTESNPHSSKEDIEKETSDHESIVCKLEKAKQNFVKQYSTETIDQSKFISLKLGENWRLAMCKCDKCADMYHSLGIDFITSKSDMVFVYEQIGLEKKKKSEEASISAISADLNKLPRVQQVEIIHAYTDFKRKLEEHLEPFRQNNRVVRPEDIQEFMEKFKARKRQRVNIPFSCR